MARRRRKPTKTTTKRCAGCKGPSSYTRGRRLGNPWPTRGCPVCLGTGKTTPAERAEWAGGALMAPRKDEAATRKEMATELRRVRKAIKDGCANLAAMHAERLAHAGFRAAVLTGSDLRVTATDAERNGWSEDAR